MDKYKKLFSNTIIFAIGTFSSKLLSLLMVRFYQAYIPEYGLSDMILIVANFLIPIATLCIAAEGIMRFGLDKEYDNSQVFTNGIFTVILGMTGLAVLFPIMNFVHLFDGYGMLIYVFVYTSSFRTLCSYFIRARGLVKLFAFDGILTTITLVLFNILFLAVFKMGVHGYILSIILSDTLSIVFLTIFAGLPRYIKPKNLNIKLWKAMLKYSIPLIPTTILWIVISGSDRFFIREMISDNANNLYTAANRLPLLISTGSMFFTQAWHMSAITENNTKGYEKFYGKVFGSYQSLMYMATAGIILLSKPIVHIWFDPKYYEAYKYIPLLLLGILFMCLGSYLSSIYAVTKQSVNSLATSGIAGIVNIALNIILIPIWGIQGAGFATMASYAICFFIRVVDTRRYVPFDVSYLKIAVNVLLLSAMTVIATFEPKNMYVWLITICLLVIIFNFAAIIKTAKKILVRK